MKKTYPINRRELKRIRENAMLTQEELAEACGISSQHVSHLETSEGVTSHAKTVRKLAKALGVEPSALLIQSSASGRYDRGEGGQAFLYSLTNVLPDGDH